MTDGDKEQFLTLIKALAATFRVDMSPAMGLGYWLGLRTLKLADIEKAVGVAIETAKFMPVPAELRRLAGEMPASDRALRAWERVLWALRHYGRGYGVDFLDNGVSNASVRLIGGWAALGNMTIDETPFRAKEFVKVYTSIVEHGIAEEQKAPIPGVYDLSPIKRIAMDLEPPKPQLPAVETPALPPVVNGVGAAKVRDYVRGLAEGKDKR